VNLELKVAAIQQKINETEEALQLALNPPEADEIIVAPKDEGPEKQNIDFTKYPGMLDAKFEKLDTDSALRATIINPSNNWALESQKGLLGPRTSTAVGAREQEDNRNKAFDLLDALTRSGALEIAEASLHVVLAATHCFDKSIIDTLVQDNMDPIQKLESSTLIVATTIHGKTVEELVKEEELERVKAYTPILFH